MKRSFSKKDFILTVLFVGIVLSGTLFLGITMLSDQLNGDVNYSVIGENVQVFLNPFTARFTAIRSLTM